MVAIAIITRFGLGRIANGRVAQLAEHTPEKRGVTGSTPVSTTICVARVRTVLLRVVAKSYQSFLRHCCYVCSVLCKHITECKSPAIEIRMAIHFVQMPLACVNVSVKPNGVL